MRKHGWKLVDANGVEVEVGATVKTSDGAEGVLAGGTPPHKPSSTGRIYVRIPDREYANEWFPSVCDLKWVQDTEMPTVDEMRAMQNFAMQIRRCIDEGKNLNLVEDAMVLLLDKVEPMLRVAIEKA